MGEIGCWWEHGTASEVALLMCQRCQPVVLQGICRRMAGWSPSIMLHLCQAPQKHSLGAMGGQVVSLCPAVSGGSCVQGQPPHLQVQC